MQPKTRRDYPRVTIVVVSLETKNMGTAFWGQREVHLYAQRFTVEIIDDIEQAQVPAVLQLVVHEVHRPDLIDDLGNGQGLWLLAHQALSGFDAQVEFQLAVDTVHALVVPAKPFDCSLAEFIAGLKNDLSTETKKSSWDWSDETRQVKVSTIQKRNAVRHQYWFI